MPAPEISAFGDGDHSAGETGLVIDGGGFGAFPGSAWMFANADGSGAADELTVGSWNDIQLSGVEIPALPNNVAGTVYLRVQREDLAWSNALAFTLSSAGNQFFQSVSGSLNPSGLIIRHTSTLLAASLGSAGAVTKLLQRSLAGSLSSAGALAALKTALLSLAGAMSSSGALVRATSKPQSGEVATSGALQKGTRRSIAGAVAASGALSAAKIALIALAGSLASAGTLTRRVQKNLAGMLTSVGSLAKQIAIAISGGLSVAGTVSAVTVTIGNFPPPSRIARLSLNRRTSRTAR